MLRRKSPYAGGRIRRGLYGGLAANDLRFAHCPVRCTQELTGVICNACWPVVHTLEPGWCSLRFSVGRLCFLTRWPEATPLLMPALLKPWTEIWRTSRSWYSASPRAVCFRVLTFNHRTRALHPGNIQTLCGCCHVRMVCPAPLWLSVAAHRLSKCFQACARICSPIASSFSKL